MSYTSNSHRPNEYASKSSHSHVINDPTVSDYLSTCALPKEQTEVLETDVTPLIDIGEVTSGLQHVIAIDGGYTEAIVKKKFPSSKIAFFQFGALFFDLEHLQEISDSEFIFPEDMAKFKQLERFKLVLPIKNMVYSDADSLTDSIRKTIHEFFLLKRDKRDFYTTLKWLVFEEFLEKPKLNYVLANCPHCSTRNINIERDIVGDDFSFKCSKCGKDLFLIDIFRLHEAIDDEIGAGGILGYVTTLIEQIVMAHYIKYILEQQPSLLNKLFFLKDGPLAFFGQTANMHKPFRSLCNYLADKHNLFIAGLEKSGSFVEHALEITKDIQDYNSLLKNGQCLLLSNKYIYKYILPKSGDSIEPYARTSYYGGKVIYKSQSGRVYVVTIPVENERIVLDPKETDFKNLKSILSTIDKLKCDMFDNSLLPIALANKLVSLAYHPSGVLLEKFAKDKISK